MREHRERLLDYVTSIDWKTGLRPCIGNNSGFARNSLCGDEIWIDLLVENASMSKIRFRGQGCMVSQACASMLCEGVEGKSVEDVLKAAPEELMDFEIRELTMNRQRCALIGYEALMNALSEYRADNMVESTGEKDGGSS